MTDRPQAVLREALNLPLDQCAEVAAELLASLDDVSAPTDPATVEAAWGREIERRARRVIAGESLGEPWENVRNRIARRLTER